MPQFAMGYGRGGRDGVTVLRGGVGLSQADNQVFNQLGKMSSTRSVAKPNVVKFIALFYSL
jgi:hypothetical protein